MTPEHIRPVDPTVELLSLPAGRSAVAIERFSVYACPQSHHAPASRYLAPRLPDGGEIPRVYKVDRVFDIGTANLAAHLRDIADEDAVRGPHRSAQVRDFCRDQLGLTDAGDEELRVFVLAPLAIELPHRPRPRANQPFKAHRWTLADLLDTTTTYLP